MTTQTEEKQADKEEEKVSSENPMIVKRVKKNAAGGVDFVFSLDYTQTYFLLDFAIRFLMTQGLVKVVDEHQEDGQPQPAEAEETIEVAQQLH